MGQGRDRAKALAAKAARRKAVVAEKKQAERSVQSLAGRVAVAARSPVERSIRTAALFEVGIGHVILTKRLPTNAIGCAFFLVDVYCLGVKDVFYKEMAPSEFDQVLADLAAKRQDVVEIEPSSALKLVKGSVDFAAKSGLAAAKDYRVIARIFGDIDADRSSDVFPFGKDGKPLFIEGPNDTAARKREITRSLDRHRGPEGWDYVLSSGLADGNLLEEILADLDDEETSSMDPDDPRVIEHEAASEPSGSEGGEARSSTLPADRLSE